MKGKLTIAVVLGTLKKILFWAATFLVSLTLFFILSLQVPGVQNYLKDRILINLNSRIGQSIDLSKITIKWFDQITLSGLSIRDYNNNILLEVAEMDIDYSITDLFADNHLILDDVVLSGGEVNLINYNDSMNVNVIEFINILKGLKNQKAKSDSTKKALNITITQVELNQFAVRVRNDHLDSTLSERINLSNFKFNISHMGIYNLEVKQDTIQARIDYLAGSENNSLFEIESFSSLFLLTNKQIRLDDFHLKTPNSELGDSLTMNYETFNDLNNFNSKVILIGRLDKSKIDLYDLSYFGNIPRVHRIFDIQSHFSGEVSNLSLKGLSLKYGDLSEIAGDIDFMGLPAIEEAFIDARIKTGRFYAEDFSEFLRNFTMNVKALGDIQFRGQFLGFLNDFVANADFDTNQGFVQSDINLKFPEGFENAKYSGNLTLNNFNAGTFIDNQELVQRVNLSGKIDGEGLTVNKANFLLDAELKDTGFFGYKYKYIKANGRFAASYFQGSLFVDDPHCQINGVGTLNLGVYPEEIEVRAFVDQLDLLDLGLSDRDINIRTSIYANIKGLDIDSIVGRLNLDSSVIGMDNRTIILDTIAISSERNNENRLVNIELAGAALELKGDFYFSQLLKDITVIAREFKGYFDPEFGGIAKEFRRMGDIRQYSVDLNLTYGNINPYIEFLTDDLIVSEGGVVEGKFYQRKNATLFLFSEIDSINYKGASFYDNVIDINASKDVDSLGVIANAYINSERQVWKNIPETRDLSIEAVWFNNKVNIQANIKQPENNSSAQINSELLLLKDRLIFNFMPSNMIAFGERWYFNPYNKIEFGGQRIIIDRLEIYNGSQSINLAGVYSKLFETDLKLSFKEFELKSISTITPVPVSGVLTSTVELKRSTNNENFRLLSILNLKSLFVDDLLIGNINGSSNWVDGLDGLSIDFIVERASIRTINVEGFYYPYHEKDQFDIVIEFDQANVKILEPLFSSMFSNLAGAASGSVKVTGSAAYPLLNGKSRIENGSFTFDYLNTTYQFKGAIGFDNETIRLDGIQLLDRDGDKASLNGSIRHKGFKRFNLGLNISANRFLFLNTTSLDNSLYYGSAKGTGDISVIGPATDLLIKAKARTEAGTKIYIPISNGSDIDQKDYINFADLSDTTNQINIDEVVSNSISGIRLDFDLDITTDAYMELIFNIRTGDIIRGRGKGNINMRLDTQGDFQLFGNIDISEGGYNFTIPNFINKEFSIQSGSTISWYGDPYAGILNLKAIYSQSASFADYYPTSDGDADASGFNPRYPFLVVLGLKGDMMSPKIDFEIKINDDSPIQPETKDLVTLANINNNEQELKRQVFSLLILRKFSVQNGFSLGGGAVGSSLSEFLSNQFSYFISQVDENLEVDIDLSTYKDANAFNTFQLRLAYTFLDGRLRVSGGGLVSQGGSDVAADNFIGDWSVRYLLTKDGHLRIKAFSQAKQRVASVNSAANLYRETGVSFQYIKSFDEFNDLLKKSRDETVQIENVQKADPKNSAL